MVSYSRVAFLLQLGHSVSTNSFNLFKGLMCRLSSKVIGKVVNIGTSLLSLEGILVRPIVDFSLFLEPSHMICNESFNLRTENPNYITIGIGTPQYLCLETDQSFIGKKRIITKIIYSNTEISGNFTFVIRLENLQHLFCSFTWIQTIELFTVFQNLIVSLTRIILL